MSDSDRHVAGQKSSSTRRPHAHGSTTTVPATRDTNKTTSTRSTPPKIDDVTRALDAEAARLAKRKKDPRWIVVPRTRSLEDDQAMRETIVELGDRYFLNFARCSDAVHDVAQMLPSLTVIKGDRNLVKRLLDDLQRIALWVQPGLDELNIDWPSFFARVPASPPVPVATQAPVPKPVAASVAPAASAASTAPGALAVPVSSSAVAMPATAVSTVPAATSSADTRSRTEPTVCPPAAAAPVSYASVTSTRPVIASPSKPCASPASPRSSCRPSSTRLVVRYPTSDTLQNSLRPHPATLTTALNKALGADYVSAIGYSHRGQLVLHTHAPYDAQQLAQHYDKIRSVLHSALALATDMTPTLETGETWSKVVVHDVPLPICSGPSDVLNVDALLADACALNGLHSATIRLARPLCPRDTLEHRFRASTSSSPQYVPILLGFSDSDTASQLLKNGMVWQYAHCRVSRYRPRRTDSAPVRRAMLPTPRATPEK